MSICLLAVGESPPPHCRGGAVAVGNFDGVHRGHAALVAELRRHADTVGGPAVAVTLDPHPLRLLRPEQYRPVLTAIHDRAALLRAAGADAVVILRTEPALLQLRAAEFFEHILVAGLGARAVVEGPDFHFGHNREGDAVLLRQLCAGADIDFHVLAPFAWLGVVVSSSKVRHALERGDVRGAADLLGRPYRLRGTVVAGDRRGRLLGFPTANLGDVATLVPADGVYAVRAHVGATEWSAAANVGPNPTFDGAERKIEVHLLGFSGDLYGTELAIDFVERIRDTKRFSGVDELTTQLRADVVRAAELTGGNA